MKREHGLANPQNQESPKSSFPNQAHARKLLTKILNKIEESHNLKKCYPNLKRNLQYHKDIYTLVKCANECMELLKNETVC